MRHAAQCGDLKPTRSTRDNLIRKALPEQMCISEEEGQKLLAEIHAGLGGHHAAARALVSKAFRTGFYWPTARADAQDLVQRHEQTHMTSFNVASVASFLQTKAICRLPLSK